ncbi:phosphatidic acid phosphatase type 2/haloperoxidase [Corynascus novoguineensis]|uniref:Phosphatidic acid phosphatase type 2/haloperoxidase n=1 Tax=Corynascus novoguineensis TaxID=1126955 RepID=A0AAN7CKU5_9PEZI|nr:phosphatidic acid phosphatase type 2/haloperoxidase [Corynascus novoguineensis]
MNPPKGSAASGGVELSKKATTPTVVEPTNENGIVDAGLKSLHHYKRALPKWRYDLRQRLLPIIRWETPYLAAFQSSIRTPALDSYFAITANLGTHTFFMIGLPILFWCGFREFGKGLVHILACGVFFTGFIKDMCSLPRPLSPPLQRITMSGSAALEYGFPSTHSANAVSVAVYAVLMLHRDTNSFSASTALGLEILAYFYAFSIVIGRLYCGMHGFVDVIVGSVMGAAISLVEFHYAPQLEAWLYSSAYTAPLTIALLIIVLVRVHPEPADDCPCFDDSVAFAGVMIGLELGTWRFARYSRFAAIYNGPNATFDLAALGWKRAIARLILGVAVIFAWREVMKPALLRFLPHLYRVIETHGLSLPRRFFVPASEYKDVPLHVRDDNVLPNVSDLPKLVRSFRGPGRGRSVSVGPQSAADAYETLAYRERRRRESLESDAGGGGLQGKRSMNGLREKAVVDGECSQVSGVQRGGRLAEFEKSMGTGTVVASPTPNGPADAVAGPDLYLGQEDELDEREVFSKLVKPRVRYDVEVVTKLVVYAGIAWLAVDIILLAFEAVGLGAEPSSP